MPEIIGQMMKPAEKIESIRIHQLSGFSGSPGAPNGDGGAKTPVNQVMDSILGMALQLPALKSIGESIGLDFSTAVGNTTITQTTPTEPGSGPSRTNK